MIVLDGNVSPSGVRCILHQLESIYNRSNSNSDDVDDDVVVRFGLVMYTSVITVYQVGLRGIASADFYHPRNNNNNNNKDLASSPPLSVVGEEDLNYNASSSSMDEFDSGLDESKERMYLGPWEGIRRCATAYFGLEDSRGDDDDRNKNTIGTIATTITHTTNTSGGGSTKVLSRKEIMKLKREARLQKRDEKKNSNNNGNNTSNARRQEIVRNDLMTMMRTATTWQTAGGRTTIESSKTTKRQRRCTGEAVAYASRIVSMHEYTTSRLVVFTSGCCSVGSGSVVVDEDSQEYGHQRTSSSNSSSRDVIDSSNLEAASHYLHLVGKDAFGKGIGVDVFCAGVGTGFGIPALLALVQPSGGYVLSHTNFREEQFCSNVEFVLTQTHMSRARVGGHHINTCTTTNPKNVINGCVLDLRMPSNVSPTHITGPGYVQREDKLDSLPNEWSAISKCYTSKSTTTDLPHPTLTRIVMGRYDPLATISTTMHVTNDTSHRHDDEQRNTNGMCFQFVVRFVNPQNSAELLTRVFSHKLETSYDVEDFIESTVGDVVPIVLGREAVDRTYLIGQHNHDDTDAGVTVKKYTTGTLDEETLASAARNDLDTTIYRISKQYRQSVPGSRNHDFPPTLVGALKKLHNFRRGAIIGPNIQSVDDMAILRDLFLRLPIDDSICMIAPVMISFHRNDMNDDGREVPPDTLALWDDCVISADNHDSMFIWRGKASSPSELLQTNGTEWLRARSHNRFPTPTLHTFSEGNSMERRLLTRLSPSHGDTKEDQCADFEDFAKLSDNMQNAVREKFRFYDNNADKSYRRWINSIVNSSPDGISLVDQRE